MDLNVLKSLENSGGYALLAGLLIIGIFLVIRETLKDQGLRTKEREELMRISFGNQLEHERNTSQNYREMADRMIDVIEGNTGAISTLVETIRPMSDTLSRLDKHMSAETRTRARQPAHERQGDAQA